MPYQEEVHNDPRYWEKPDQFFPEHFIDDKGNLITKKRGFLPFSLGNNYFCTIPYAFMSQEFFFVFCRKSLCTEIDFLLFSTIFGSLF